MSDLEIVTLDIAEGVATVVINRPHVRNALNRQALFELDGVLDRLAADDEVRGVLLTGAGDRAFVAGADIAEIQALDVTAARAFARLGQGVFRRLEWLGKPVVAAVNGYALGGGCELAMACTIRLASPAARFGQPEVALGLMPGFGGTQRLPRLVGRGRALDLLLSGRVIDAEEAFRIGLVDRVVPAEDLLAAGREWLDAVRRQAPRSVRACLEAVDRGAGLPLDHALALEADLFAQGFATSDLREGTAAFLEKRRPEFTGR